MVFVAVPAAFAKGQDGGAAADNAELPEFDPNEKIELTVPSSMNWDSPALWEAFGKKYPNITLVKGAPMNASQNEPVFLTKAASGDVDDVFGGGDESPDMYGPRGIYMDLTPWLERDKDLWYDSEKFKHWWIYKNPDGAIYSVPVGGNPMVLVYNKDLLDAAGLEYPPDTYSEQAYDDWTWDKFKEYAVTLTDKDKGVFGAGIENNILIYLTFLHSAGARLVDKDLTDFTIDSPMTVETFKYLTSFALEGLAPEPSAAQEQGGMNDLFMNDKVAMFVVGAWMVGGAYHPAEVEAGKNIGVAALPYKTQKDHFVLAPAMRVGIYAKTKHPAAAYEFLKFFYFGDDAAVLDVESITPWMSNFGREDWTKQFYADGIHQNSKWGKNARDLSYLWEDHSSERMMITEPEWNGPFPETRDILLAEMGLVFTGTQTLDEAVQRINEQCDAIMDRWQRNESHRQ